MDEQPITKEERRQRRRDERESQSRLDFRHRFTRRVVIWTIVVAVLVGIGWLMFREAGNLPQTTDGTLSVPVSASDLITGPASASVTLLEYSDFQCPACGAFHPILQQFLADPQASGKVRLVYRYFPLRTIHANAQGSAQAAQAASLQGKFWQMHDRLFEQQAAWENLSQSAAKDKFISYAGDLGIDVPKFTADFDSDAVKNAIQADYDSAVSSGVDSTPTFFVNGNKLPSPTSYDAFKSSVLQSANANQ